MKLQAGLGIVFFVMFIVLRCSGMTWANINDELLDPAPLHSFINFFNLTK